MKTSNEVLEIIKQCMFWNFHIKSHGEKYRTNLFFRLNKILVLLTKSFVKEKAITNSFVGSTNSSIGKTKNLLGKQKSFVSSISTIWLVNTIFFLRACWKYSMTCRILRVWLWNILMWRLGYLPFIIIFNLFSSFRTIEKSRGFLNRNWVREANNK